MLSVRSKSFDYDQPYEDMYRAYDEGRISLIELLSWEQIQEYYDQLITPRPLGITSVREVAPPEPCRMARRGQVKTKRLSHPVLESAHANYRGYRIDRIATRDRDLARDFQAQLDEYSEVDVDASMYDVDPYADPWYEDEGDQFEDGSDESDDDWIYDYDDYLEAYGQVV